MNDESGRKLLIDGNILAFGKKPQRKVLSEIKDVITGKSETFPESKLLGAPQRTKLANELLLATSNLLDVVRNGLWEDDKRFALTSRKIDGEKLLSLDHGKISFLFQESAEEKMLEFRRVAGG